MALDWTGQSEQSSMIKTSWSSFGGERLITEATERRSVDSASFTSTMMTCDTHGARGSGVHRGEGG